MRCRAATAPHSVHRIQAFFEQVVNDDITYMHVLVLKTNRVLCVCNHRFESFDLVVRTRNTSLPSDREVIVTDPFLISKIG